jgi:hypothetical protein
MLFFRKDWYKTTSICCCQYTRAICDNQATVLLLNNIVWPENICRGHESTTASSQRVLNSQSYLRQSISQLYSHSKVHNYVKILCFYCYECIFIEWNLDDISVFFILHQIIKTKLNILVAHHYLMGLFSIQLKYNWLSNQQHVQSIFE